MVLKWGVYVADPFLHLPEAPRGLTIGAALALARGAPNPRTAPRLSADEGASIKTAPQSMVLIWGFYVVDPFLHLLEAPRGLEIAVAIALAHAAHNPRMAPLLPADVCAPEPRVALRELSREPRFLRRTSLARATNRRGRFRARRTSRTSPGPDLSR